MVPLLAAVSILLTMSTSDLNTDAPELPESPKSAKWLHYPGDANRDPGRARRVVLLAGDEEYRSEEAMPMIARLLNQHGFETIVLLSQDPQTSQIDPDQRHYIPGMHLIDGADLVIMQLRFRELPDADMKHLVDYVDSGKPLTGIRTSTHAFAYRQESTSPYRDWSWDRNGGFGRNVLGETWVAHHGRHGAEATRGVVDGNNAAHPVLRGIEDVFGTTDVYAIRELPDDSVVLLRGAILTGMSPSDKPVEDARNNPMHPIAWLRMRPMPNGPPQRIFVSTMGAAHDWSSEDLRRLLTNATLWQLGESASIPEDGLEAPIIGHWNPTPFGFGTARTGFRVDEIYAGHPPPDDASPPPPSTK